MKKTRQYFFEYTPEMGEFLTENNIPYVCGDADIVSVTFEGYNDNDFVLMVLEFSSWFISKTIKNHRNND